MVGPKYSPTALYTRQSKINLEMNAKKTPFKN